MEENQNVEFRRVLIPDELEALCAFDQKVFGSYPEDIFAEEDWRELESYWMIVDGNTVGCLALKRDIDYDEEPRPGCLYIESTGVLPECQGRGYGNAMKAWQIAYAKQNRFDLIVTNARESNRASISLNEKYGFKTRAVVPEYYSAPDEAAVVMELVLDASERGSRSQN
jgi:ribosomal protein S18 acetylase RimI-like enzyme